MRDELLAYLLNDLDEEQRRRIEQRLEVDPIWQHELERLRAYVEEAHQTSAAEDEAVPEDLVNRTCSFVKQASCLGAYSPAVLPAALSESEELAAAKSNRWTLIDFGVVACVLLVMGTLLIPAIRESRESARRVQCQEKLRILGSKLAAYAKHTGGNLPAIEEHENAGMYAVKLLESGLLTQRQLAELLVCPSTQLADDIFRGVKVFRVPSRRELQRATSDQRMSLLEDMGGSFAYRVGYYDERGRYRQIDFFARSSAPLMADKPSFAFAALRSANHGGGGQNVLFQDGHANYYSVCKQEGRDDNWFLNEDGQPAAGKHESDVVMIRSEARP